MHKWMHSKNCRLIDQSITSNFILEDLICYYLWNYVIKNLRPYFKICCYAFAKESFYTLNITNTLKNTSSVETAKCDHG